MSQCDSSGWLGIDVGIFVNPRTPSNKGGQMWVKCGISAANMWVYVGSMTYSDVEGQEGQGGPRYAEV